MFSDTRSSFDPRPHSESHLRSCFLLPNPPDGLDVSFLFHFPPSPERTTPCLRFFSRVDHPFLLSSQKLGRLRHFPLFLELAFVPKDSSGVRRPPPRSNPPARPPASGLMQFSRTDLIVFCSPPNIISVVLFPAILLTSHLILCTRFSTSD